MGLRRPGRFRGECRRGRRGLRRSLVPLRAFDEADEGRLEVVGAAGLHQGDRSVAGQDGAGVHQRDAVAAEGLVHEVGRDEDRHLLTPREVDEQLPELVPRDRVDARGGLVEDQHLRLVDHRHGQGEPLSDAERQHVGEVVEMRAEAEPGHEFVDPPSGPVGRKVKQPGVQPEVLPDGQLAVEGEGLRHVADPTPGIGAVGVDPLAEQEGLPRARRQQAGEHLHGGRLPAAVGAEEAEDLPPIDLERHVLHGGEGAEAAGQVAGHDRGRTSGGHADRDRERPVGPPIGDRQQRDERLLERPGSGPPHQVGGRAGGEDPPPIHRDQPVEAGRLVHVGRGHDHAHRGTITADAIDQGPELLSRERIDAGGRLVEDQEVGIVHQRRAQPNLLLHSPRELPGGAIRESRQSRGGEQVGDPGHPFAVPLAEEAGEKVDVLEHAEVHRQVPAEPLRHERDPRADGVAVPHVGHVAAEHGHPARLDPLRSGHQPQERRLADPVGADQSHHAPGGDLHGQVAERRHVAEAVREPGDRGDRARPGGHACSVRVRPRRRGSPWRPLRHRGAAGTGARDPPARRRHRRASRSRHPSGRSSPARCRARSARVEAAA